jgi:elongator complex protein 3
MPKSYLADEPGAMRGLEHDFDPYGQVQSRLQALEILGHPTDKVELLVLGGTWSSYRRDYQEWFIKRCFDALNDPKRQQFEAEPNRPGSLAGQLVHVQAINESAAHRNVGLVIETRPDEITPDEVRWLRHLGVTKVQMGAQSLDDRILEMNRRGHDVECTRRATALLRAAEDSLRLQGYTHCFLYVLDTNIVARRFYEKSGYSWDGSGIDCPVGTVTVRDLRYVKEL